MRNWLQNKSISLLKLLSRLPFSVLYFVSDILSLIILYVLPYRKSVVKSNFENSFPDQSPQQLKRWRTEFYHYLTDLLVESLKAFSISKSQLTKRVKFVNTKAIQKYSLNQQPVIVIMGHYGNWELIGLAGYSLPAATYSLYRRQKNEAINKLLLHNRQRFGLHLIEEKESLRQLPKLLSEKKGNMITFIADQAVTPRRAYWVNFLNQPATFVKGPETYAAKYNCPVFYLDIQVIKRGHYKAEFILLSDCPANLKEGELTMQFAQKLEETIENNPPFWLWSHRRWKHQKQ